MADESPHPPRLPSILIKIVIILTVFGLGALASTAYSQRFNPKLPTAQPKDKYLTFLDEVYDKIQANYWDKINEEQLVNLYVLGTEKLTSQPQILKKQNRAEMEKMVTDILKQFDTEEKKKNYTVQLADVVLANLSPFGHSRLYSQKEEKQLSDNVQNVSQTNQYEALGVDKTASQKQVQKTYEEKAAGLKADKSPEAAQKLAQLNKAYDTLKDQATRKNYDTAGVETTVSYKVLRPEILYLRITKMSPTTPEDFIRVADKVNNQPALNTLILDLRDNVGGAIDSLPFLLGPFIGNDQYAYQFYHQGDKADFKTRVGWLPSLARYKKVVILINENTQSSAEVMAATLKKYNVGVLVGTKTKGWGTVERVFPLDNQLETGEKYSLFLVHSLTLRDDGQPIQDKGVEPLIDIKKVGWEKELLAHFNYQELVNALKEIL